MSMTKVYQRFPDVHPNIILKIDLLTQGMDVSEAAIENFRQRDDILWRGYHLFSYDRKKTKVYGDKIPHSFHFHDGCPVQLRTNEDSPYSLDLVDGDFVIRYDNEIIARGLFFEPKPKWYDMKLEDGTPMAAIVQSQVRFLFTTLNRYCEFWNTGDQCLFCDINATLRDQKKGGEDMVARIQPSVIAEAVKTAVDVDYRHHAICITGGTILGKYQGQSELDFYCNRLIAIRDKLGAWIPSTFQIAAQDDEGWKKVYETGVTTVQPNIEIWDKNLFKWMCPGKDKFIGYDEWIKRTIRGVDFWGRGRVQPNFVLGVEMAKPHGFEKVNDAVKSTASGWDFLMSHGVLPRFNLWSEETNAALTSVPGQQYPPLEYFVEVQKAYTELRWKHNFDPPFPSTWYRYGYHLSCLHDFEYYHGNGTLSKKKLDERLGVKPGERGGREDQDGYTLSWD